MPAGRPVGSKTKINGSKVAEICEARGVCLVSKQLDLAEMLIQQGDLADAAKVYNSLMKYQYAPRTPEDASGNPMNFGAQPPEVLDLIDKALDANPE